MKKLFTVALCLTILINIFAPFVNASEATSTASGNIFSDDNYAIYSYEDSTQLLNIILDMHTGIGSFAIKYADVSTQICEYVFTISIEDIHIDSLEFWEELISYCFDNDSEWTSIFLPSSVTVVTPEENQKTRAASYDYAGAYMSLLEAEYGNVRSNYYVKTSVVNGVVFMQYENVDLGVSKSNSYIINYAMTAAGLITSVLGLVTSKGLLTVIGLVATVGGVVTAGTRLDEYQLHTIWEKYITANGGTIKHSFVSMIALYTGYGSNKVPVSDELSLNLLEAHYSYTPSQAVFNSDSAQFNEAYQSYIA